MGTDFSAYSYQALLQMLHDSDPDQVTAAGDVWASVGMSLHAHADGLAKELQAYDGMWQGDAAAAYHSMISDLVDGVRQTAANALTVRDLTYHASDVLKRAWMAWTALPDPAGLPAPTPPAPTSTTAALNTAALNTAALNTAGPPAPAINAAAMTAQALTFTGDAHAKAVAIMTELASQDMAIDSALPQPPAATVPSLAADGTVLPTATGGQVNAADPAVPPLFSKFFGAGLAAAGAAAGGKFGTAALKMPPTTPSPTSSKAVGVVAAAKLAGLGGGAIGVAAARPVASPSLYGSASATGMDGVSAAAGVGGAAGGTAGSGSMPPMGYGAGMGAGDDAMGGGRRIPPWLVETEDLWGEPTTVTPSVIGEEPPDLSGNAYGLRRL